MHKLSALEIRGKFLSGAASALEIVDYFLERIDRYDGQLGAFIEVYRERARDRARALDKRRLSGGRMGRLAGIPIALKDNIHVKGEITTCASKFLTNYRAPFDATVTELLENDDAIIIGKTNMDEFAMGSSTENSALQVTRNPWDLERVAGGSSGGSAVAVAARLAPLALGSDTGGSIRQPAALTGIIGFKPTYGRVSRYGLVAFGSSLDQIGPFATSAEDIALIMEVIGSHCPKDSTSLPDAPGRFLSSLNVSLYKKKIGVPWHFLEGLSSETQQFFKNSLERMKQYGAELVDIDLSLLNHSIAVYYIIATAEASTNLARFDGVRYGNRSSDAKSLKELYDLSKEEGYGDEVKRRILLGTYVLSAGYQDAYYKKAQKVRTRMIQQFNAAFAHCNFIAMPSTPSTAFKLGEIKEPIEMYLEDLYTIPVNLAGLPAITLPEGFNDKGLPYGLQLIAPQKGDVELVATAAAYCKDVAYRHSPPDQFAK